MRDVFLSKPAAREYRGLPVPARPHVRRVIDSLQQGKRLGKRVPSATLGQPLYIAPARDYHVVYEYPNQTSVIILGVARRKRK